MGSICSVCNKADNSCSNPLLQNDKIQSINAQYEKRKKPVFQIELEGTNAFDINKIDLLY